MSATINWTRQSIGGACQTSEMAALLNSLYLMFKYVFLPTYRLKNYDYIVKSCSGIQCKKQYVSLDIAYILALTTMHINAIIISSL